jgi:hypothetical protein
MELLHAFLPRQSLCVPPPIGSRTQGMIDPLAYSDAAELESLAPVRIACVAAAGPDQTFEPSPLIVSLAAAERPELRVLPQPALIEACAAYVAQLKTDYQHVRLEGRRPWPEFVEALFVGRPGGSDCECLFVLRGVRVASGGGVPGCLLDAPLSTPVLRACDGESVPLGAVLAPLAPDDARGVHEVARSLALSTGHRRDVLESKIATRLLELGGL